MCSSAKLNILLQKIAAIYVDVYGENIRDILLYGSYARGTFNEDSDIDIVALVNGDRVMLQKKLEIVWDRTHELELEYETLLSLTVIPFEEFQKYREDLPYYRNIEKEGISIVA